VKTTRPVRRPQISGDGTGIVGHAGSLLLHELADRVGLTQALSQALAHAFPAWRQHDPGSVVRDLAVMLADGGDCLSDLCVLRDHPSLFGGVASDATAWRVIDRLSGCLEAIRKARAQARCRAWDAGLRPRRIVLDIDSTLVTTRSEKEGAAATYKRGLGFHPFLCTLDGTGETLAAILRPGNASAAATDDLIAILEAGVAQLPSTDAEEPVLVRADSAGASRPFLETVRAHGFRFSVGFDLREPVREAILALPNAAWVPAISQDAEERDGAVVAELLHLDLATWPPETRAIVRREIPHPGAQLRFTDQPDADLAYLDALHRRRARMEDGIAAAKDTGLRCLPFREWGPNEVWVELVLIACDLMAWLQRGILEGERQRWEPKRLRYRLLHVAGRLCRSGRTLTPRLLQGWRWTPVLCQAFERLRALLPT
jgi:hypothetical protein